MADVDDVLARLRAEARLTCRLGFTLDRARAREKMREFQLADPRRWVLLLVRAAIMRGATRVSITTDPTGMSIEFDGTPLGALDFDELYASMFAAADDPLARSRRELRPQSSITSPCAGIVMFSWPITVSFSCSVR